jgi:hypothetical protein
MELTVGDPRNMGRDELLERLRQFDRAVALEYPGCVFQLVIVGGGAMVLLGVLSRPTDDIDAVSFAAELQPLMEQFDVSGRVRSYEDHFPLNFEDRLVPVEFPWKAVQCFTASLEDLVVSKLYSNRPVDSTDIRRPAVVEALDWDQLASAVIEARLSNVVERRYREMVSNYEAYREECQPCEP